MGTERKRGRPASNRPKAETLNVSLYPAERAALEWWKAQRDLESLADAARSVIDVAMTLAKGAEWRDGMDLQDLAA